MKLPQSVQRLIEELQKLPSIGPRTAERLTYFLLRGPQDQLDLFSEALYNLKRKTVTCSVCFNIAETDPCAICSDAQRDSSKICVVEEPLDVVALEKTGKFEGFYHVLGGAINPVAGIGPEELRIGELIRRIEDRGWRVEYKGEGRGWTIDERGLARKIKDSTFHPQSSKRGRSPSDSTLQPPTSNLEIILATNPSLEGEATAMYIKRRIEGIGNRAPGLRIEITRIARGLPTGGDLEYADQTTLSRALEGRQEF